MKILLYTLNFSPEPIGIGKYSGEMATWFANKGHDVRVVTSPPYYPHWCIGGHYSNKWIKEKIDNSVTVYRCPLWVPKKPSGSKRILHLLSFALSSFPVILCQTFWRPDIIFLVEPTLFCAPQSLLVARLSKSYSCLHIQDFEVDAAYSLGLLNASFLRSIAQSFERFLMKRFDLISTISSKMLERVLEKGVDSERSLLFRNWVDIDGLNRRCDKPRPYREELGLAANSFVALYSGNLGKKQGLDIIPMVARLLPHVTFVVCGDGSGRADLLDLCLGIDNIVFLSVQPIDDLGCLLKMADIHLLLQSADAADLVMPSKLTGMLASERPIVATAQAGTEVANVVKGRGLIVPPGQPEPLAEAISSLISDDAIREDFGKAGLEYAKLYLDKNAVLEAFEADISKRLDLLKDRVDT